MKRGVFSGEGRQNKTPGLLDHCLAAQWWLVQQILGKVASCSIFEEDKLSGFSASNTFLQGLLALCHMPCCLLLGALVLGCGQCGLQCDIWKQCQSTQRGGAEEVTTAFLPVLALPLFSFWSNFHRINLPETVSQLLFSFYIGSCQLVNLPKNAVEGTLKNICRRNE